MKGFTVRYTCMGNYTDYIIVLSMITVITIAVEFL